MANQISRILMKRSGVASAAPSASELLPGELSLNIYDGKLYYLDSKGGVQCFIKDALPIDGVADKTVRDGQGNVITETYVTKTSLNEGLIDYIALYESIMNGDSGSDQVGEVGVSAGGRKLYRHSSGMGTVIEFNDGQARKVLVLDAQYRQRMLELAAARSGTIREEIDLPEYDPDADSSSWFGLIQVGDANIHGFGGYSNGFSPAEAEQLTDEFLNSRWWVDTNTSKHNTTAWINGTVDGASIDSEACEHCRSITVDGVACDLPNIQTVMRMYCEATNLDEMDPTANQYPELSMVSLMSVGGAGSSDPDHIYYEAGIWSSTRYVNTGSWSVLSGYADGNMMYGVVTLAGENTEEFSVAPVLEL